jgi:hypothetical protein
MWIETHAPPAETTAKARLHPVGDADEITPNDSCAGKLTAMLSSA